MQKRYATPEMMAAHEEQLRERARARSRARYAANPGLDKRRGRRATGTRAASRQQQLADSLRHRYSGFTPGCCANCDQPLAGQPRLYCSEVCQQTAITVRYWRRVMADGRIKRGDVVDAIKMRMAHILAGGYPSKERSLPPELREAVKIRDMDKCRSCGSLGDEIDHIAGNENTLNNLQLLCHDCHHAKTIERFGTPSAEQLIIAYRLEDRARASAPLRLCDDQDSWKPSLYQALLRQTTAVLAGIQPEDA